MSLFAPKSPTGVQHWATRVCKITAPLALLDLAAMGLGIETDDPRMLVGYLTLLLLCVVSGALVFVAASQVAIHEAFSAGFQTGQASVFPDDADTIPQQQTGRHDRSGRSKDPLLRLVD